MFKRLLFVVGLFAVFVYGAAFSAGGSGGNFIPYTLYNADSLGGATACTTSAVPVYGAKAISFYYGCKDSLLSTTDIYCDTLSAAGVQFSHDGTHWSGIAFTAGAQTPYGAYLDQSTTTGTSGVRPSASAPGAYLLNVRQHGATANSNVTGIGARFIRFTMTVASRDRATGNTADAAMYRPFIKAMVLYDSGIDGPPGIFSGANGPTR